MKKSKNLIFLLILGAFSTSALVGCGNTPNSNQVEENKDEKAAENVMTLINALTDTSLEADVSAARSAYDALTDAQKLLVTNLVKLTKQETRIADNKAVQAVIAAIGGLSDESSENQVNEVFGKYAALKDDLKDKVTNISVLMYQKARIDAAEVVNPVISAISALTDESSKADVQAAKNAYDALSNDDKSFVPDTVVSKLEGQVARILQADIDAVKNFLDSVVIEDLVSDVAVIPVLKELASLNLSEEVVDGLSETYSSKLGLLKRTTDAYGYAGENQAKSWREQKWENDAYGLLDFKTAVLDTELNAMVRPFDVTYFVENEVAHQEFGMTLVGDTSLKGAHDIVVYIYNPDVETTLRIDYAKPSDDDFCTGGNITLLPGWNKVSVNCLDVQDDKNVINFMIGVFNNSGGITQTTGWKVSSFVKYDGSVSGTIRTDYYRVLKVINAYMATTAVERNQYSEVVKEYAKLTAAEKELLPAGVEEKIAADAISFKQADARALKDLIDALPAVNDQTNYAEYAILHLMDILNYKEQYEEFDSDQKALVTNGQKLFDVLDSLDSYTVLLDGKSTFNAWDYGAAGNTTTGTDSVYGDVQTITFDDTEQHSLTLPNVSTYTEYDSIIISVYCPEGRMSIVNGTVWPYNYGTLNEGQWNIISVPASVTAGTYPQGTLGFLINGAGEWKFGKAVGFVNKAGANALVDIINGLAFTEHTTAEEEAIAAARSAYNALGSVSKTMVTNIAKLEELEASVESFYVDTVINQINALEFDDQGSTQEAQKAAIEAARAAYNALSDARKAAVTNYSKLTDLEVAVEAYYLDQSIAAVESYASSLPEITKDTTFDTALKILAKIESFQAKTYYDQVAEGSRTALSEAKSAIEAIYIPLTSTVSDHSDFLGGAKDSTITAKNDEEFGTVTSITKADGNGAYIFGSSSDSLSGFDYLYLMVKATNEPNSFNIWTEDWAKSATPNFTSGEWSLLKIDIEALGQGTLDRLVFCLQACANNKEVLLSKVFATLKPAPLERVFNDGDKLYGNCGVNSSLNDWATFTETDTDAYYGDYKIANLAAASSGSFDVIVNHPEILEVNKYDFVKFALYNPTQGNVTLSNIPLSGLEQDGKTWKSIGAAVGVQNISLKPGWNNIVINADELENSELCFITLRFDFTNGGNADGWRITDFYGKKYENTLTSYHFGQVTPNTQDTYGAFGRVYDLIQEQWFIDNPDAATMASAGTGVLRALLPEGKTELTFAIYNPNESAVNFHIAGGEPWGDALTVSLAPQAWTTITLGEAEFALNDTGAIYYYIGNSNASGWQVTGIFAK